MDPELSPEFLLTAELEAEPSLELLLWEDLELGLSPEFSLPEELELSPELLVSEDLVRELPPSIMLLYALLLSKDLGLVLPDAFP